MIQVVDCDLQGRKIIFTNSKTLVSRPTETPASRCPPPKEEESKNFFFKKKKMKQYDSVSYAVNRFLEPFMRSVRISDE